MIHLLPRVPRYFKANLHAHSTVSDGKLTPEEVKRLYQSHGYQILAFTDHNLMAWHRQLDEPGFLTLAGGEFDVNQKGVKVYFGLPPKSYHLNLLARDPASLWQPFDGNRTRPDVAALLEGVEIAGLPREHTVEAINAVIAQANAHGNLVVYNHPVWSLHEWEDVADLRGLWGMEIYNTGSVRSGLDENNAWLYHALLRRGTFLQPVAADDFHSERHFAGGWNMVGAKELTYSAVMEGLEKGDHYATTGPEIYDLALDGDTLCVDCSDAASVRVQTHGRLSRRVQAEGDAPLRRAEFDLEQWLAEGRQAPGAFLRVTVEDARGRYAVTRAYRACELG